MDTTGPTPVNVAREMQQKITEARQSGNLDALIAIENELGQIADETDKMIAGVMRGGAQYVPPVVGDVPRAGDVPEAPTAPPEEIFTGGQLLPQVEGSDAVQTLPPDTERATTEEKLDNAL
jgi:hypothetical protein